MRERESWFVVCVLDFLGGFVVLLLPKKQKRKLLSKLCV